MQTLHIKKINLHGEQTNSLGKEGRKYLMTHSIHFIHGYMASGIWKGSL